MTARRICHIGSLLLLAIAGNSAHPQAAGGPGMIGLHHTPPAIAWVKNIDFYNASASTTIAATFGTSVSNTNLIICWIEYQSSTYNVISIADNYSNTYNHVTAGTVHNATLGYSIDLWYAQNVTGGSGFTVTATLSASTPGREMSCHEYSGALPSGVLDQQTSGSGTSAAPTISGITTTYPRELIFTVAMMGAGPASVGAGFTTRSTNQGDIAEEKIVTAMGTYSAPTVNSGGSAAYSMIVGTFKSR